MFFDLKWKNEFQKIYFIFHIWLLNWKTKNEKKLFLNLFWFKINFKNKNQNFRIHFLISSQKMNIRKFLHFSILVMKLKNKTEKFSKFVLFLNQKTNYTFGTRIKNCIWISKFDLNKDQNLSFIFYFLKKLKIEEQIRFCEKFRWCDWSEECLGTEKIS